MAIFLTGDTHGDFRRFENTIFYEQVGLTKRNCVIICGDMGGASSHDIADGILEPDDPEFKEKQRRLEESEALYRINHVSWWKEELPSDEEYQMARANLEKCGWKVDYIITHCCSTSVQDELSGGFYQADALTDFLDEITRRCQFKYHFFGHYHTNTVIQKKYVLLYEQIIRLKL